MMNHHYSETCPLPSKKNHPVRDCHLHGKFGIPIHGQYVLSTKSTLNHHHLHASPKRKPTFKLAQRVKQVSRRAALAGKRRLWDTHDVYDEAAQSAVDVYESTYHSARSFIIQSFSTAKRVYNTTKDGVQKIEHALLVPVRDALILPAFCGIERAVDHTVGFLQSPQAAGMASGSLELIRHTPLIGEHVLAPMIVHTVNAVKCTWHVLQYPIPSRDLVRSTVDGLVTGTKYFLVNSWKEVYFYTKLVDASITRALSHTQWRVLGYGPYSSLNDIHKMEVIDHLCERYLSLEDDISRYELACHIKFHNWKLYHDLVVTGLLYERGNSSTKADDVWLSNFPEYIMDANEAMLLGCQEEVRPLWFYIPNRNGKQPKGAPWVLFHPKDWKNLEKGFQSFLEKCANGENGDNHGVDAFYLDTTECIYEGQSSKEEKVSESMDCSEYPTIAQWYEPNLKMDVLVDDRRYAVSFQSDYNHDCLPAYLDEGEILKRSQVFENDSHGYRVDTRFRHLNLPVEILMRPTLWRFHGMGNEVRRGVWLLHTQKHGLQPYCEQSASVLEDAYLYLKWREERKQHGDTGLNNLDSVLLTVQVMFGEETQLVQFRSLKRITAIQKTVAGGLALFKRRVFRGIASVEIENEGLLSNRPESEKDVLPKEAKLRITNSHNENNDLSGSRHDLEETAQSKELKVCMKLAAPRTLINSARDEISDLGHKCNKVDHLVLVVHGIGEMLKTGDLRLPLPSLTSSIIDCCDSLRRNLCDILKDDQFVGHNVEFIPIEWHEPFALQSRRKSKIEYDSLESASIRDISLDTIPHLRNFANDTMLDILYFMSPRHHDIMVDIVTKQLNLVVEKYKKLNSFKGNISILSHSLGSVITWDILSHQKKVKNMVADIENIEAHNLKANAYLSTPETDFQYPPLNFEVDNCFMIGSPVAVFLMMRNQSYKSSSAILLPRICRFFNIFHPYDPVAYRLEPLLNRKNARVEPQIIPHWKFGLRVQYQTKYFLQKLIEETEKSKENAIKAVEESMKAIGLLDDSVDDDASYDESNASGDNHDDHELSVYFAGDSSDGKRLDFMLQERELETANEYIAALAAHSSYWDSKDLGLFIAKEIWPKAERTLPDKLAVHF